jgi:hypothetical protein
MRRGLWRSLLRSLAVLCKGGSSGGFFLRPMNAIVASTRRYFNTFLFLRHASGIYTNPQKNFRIHH